MSLCVFCGRGHDTPLVLCPECEEKAVQMKLKRGETPR